MRHLLLILLMAGAPALAQTCPKAPDHSEALGNLIAQTRAATTENEGSTVARQMWRYWTDAPNDQAQQMLDRAMSRIRGSDLVGALRDLDALVAYCPEFAEGYNQRAYAYFLARRYAPALEDLDRAIDLSPRHVAAIAGKALTLLGMGRKAEARIALNKALALNPWLSERHLAAPGGPLAEIGQDI